MVTRNLEMQIKEFKPWLEKETENLLQPLNEQGKKIVTKVEERLSDARETCEKLVEEGSKETERGKAIRKAKVTQKLSRYFLKQIDKIVFPEKLSFNELDKLHKDLEKMFSSIARERNAWFPRISPLFIIARKRVDFAFSRLAGSISELGTFLSDDYSKARVAEKLFLETEETLKLLNELGKYEKHKAIIEKKKQNLQKKIENGERNLDATKSSTELDNLSEINQKIQQLKKQVRYNLRHLQKPFLKFANLARGPGHALTAEEVEKLNHYLKDPFFALVTEKTGYPVLKSILKKIERAIDDGKLKLKSSRLRKGREEINAILNKNKLDSLHQNCTHAFSLENQIISSEETQVAKMKLKQLERKLGELQKRKEIVVARFDALEREHTQLLEKIREQKMMLEKSVFEVLEKRVNLEF